MKTQNSLLIATALVLSIFISTDAFAKTAKDCKAEWQADKAGMQSRGVTQKAYIEQCKGGAEPTAAAPSAKPMEAPAPAQATTGGSKTAKACKEEWQADKAGMKARGVTQRAYVEQCRGGSTPVVAAPQAPPPAAAPSPTSTSSSQKTAKECVAEWRADKAGMQARGVTQKAYVAQCRAGEAAPSAAAPEPRPTAAAPAPAPTRPAPTATEAAPAPTPQRPAPSATTAPTQAPAPRSTASLEAGQFADEASAKARCPADTIVWVNLPSKIYHFAGTRSYGTTKRGAYMCEKEAIAAENRASKTESHP